MCQTVHLLWSTKYQLCNSYSSIIFITSWSSNYEGNVILWHLQDSPFHFNLHYNASLKIVLSYILSLGISSLEIRWGNEFISRNIWGLKPMCHPRGSWTLSELDSEICALIILSQWRISIFWSLRLIDQFSLVFLWTVFLTAKVLNCVVSTVYCKEHNMFALFQRPAQTQWPMFLGNC